MPPANRSISQRRVWLALVVAVIVLLAMCAEL
jgi:hypothetical protein